MRDGRAPSHASQELMKHRGFPAGQVPAWQVPAGRSHDGQVPAGQVITGQVPAGRVPVGQVPAEKQFRARQRAHGYMSARSKGAEDRHGSARLCPVFHLNSGGCGGRTKSSRCLEHWRAGAVTMAPDAAGMQPAGDPCTHDRMRCRFAYTASTRLF